MRIFKLLLALSLASVLFAGCSNGSSGSGEVTTSEISISGKLENSFGYPASGVDAVLEKDGLIVGETVTDINGEYSFLAKQGSYSLSFSGGGYSGKTISVNTEEGGVIPVQQVTVDFGTNGIVIGKISEDAEGIIYVGDADIVSGSTSVKSTYKGYYSIVLPHGTHDILFRKTGHIGTSRTHTFSENEPYVIDNIVMEVDTPNYGAVYGTVSQKLGGIGGQPEVTIPFYGAEVRLRLGNNPIQIVYSDDKSVYRFVDLHNTYDVRGVSGLHINYTSDPFDLSATNPYQENNYVMDLDTSTYGAYYGHMADEFGRDLSGVEITFNGQGDKNGDVISDSTGFFYAILDHGSYDAIFEKDGFKKTARFSIDLSENKPFDNPASPIMLNYETANLHELHGHIYDSLGNAIANVVVSVYSGETLLRSVNTNDNGRYSTALPDGDYTVDAMLVPYSHKIEEITIDSDDLLLDLSLGSNKGRISSGFGVSYIDDNGDLWNWGDSTYALSGITTVPKNVTPTYPELSNLVMTTTGYNPPYSRGYTVALRSDQKLYSWGYNANGQLGINNTTNKSTPVEVMLGNLNGDAIVDLSAGMYHVLALTSKRQVAAWGGNAHYQLGFSDTSNVLVPTLIPGLDNISSVQAGDLHSAVLTKDGKVYTWGNNSYGQLGVTSADTHIPQLVSGFDSDVIEISVGGSHTLALTRKGTLYGWGYNNYKQVNSSTSSTITTPQVLQVGIIEIEAGNYTSFAIKNSGEVLSWGYNSYSSRGDLTSLANKGITTLSGGVYGGQAIDSKGQVYTWGRSQMTGIGVESATPINITDKLQ